MIVIDASALVELLVGGTPRAALLAVRVGIVGESLHAPHLIDLEVASVLRSLEARKAVSTAVATRAIVDLVALDLRRYAHDTLVPRAWQLRGHLSSYDAAYVALAEILAAPLVTCDRRLGSSPGHAATIEVFP
jgi:predicted nucleic acid-binding protein